MSVKAQETLIAILSTGICNASQTEFDSTLIDWDDLVGVARANKVFPLLSHHLDSLGIEPPDHVRSAIKTMRLDCFSQSMSHIAAAVRLCRNLHTHGIDAVCIKGTARAYEVYGKWDVRFTHDIDLLVPARDYREAAKVLTSTGYEAPISEHDVWWHRFLGESPYLPIAATGPTVDLHYKLHQPGTPALTNPAPLHEKRVMRDLGQFALPMLDKRDAMMLTANSFGKAIRARQPWLTYAHEIAYARANDPHMSDDILDDYAESCGMRRLWNHAKRTADAVFEASSSAQVSRAYTSQTQHPALLPEPQYLYRSRLLWRWSEGIVMRPFNFLRELIWVNMAEIQHDLFANRRIHDRQNPQEP